MEKYRHTCVQGGNVGANGVVVVSDWFHSEESNKSAYGGKDKLLYINEHDNEAGNGISS